ncbi:hypothetical protein PGS49_19805 [Yersinia intermedia]|uniref:hypothetical protein n=1 Tax=Yersinia intermedia TaxID=631 RepID=UPI0022FDF0F0|nr:hypothetical protein [Yersinia intermedia]MDA5482873.1 hypothetical protein [Yersinia intermedia]
MMDITKSPYEFQAWWNAPEQAELRNSCAMGWGFRIWKAARESIEVDIPEEMTCREALELGHTSDYANGFTAAIIQCYSVVRTAGIRIKGESE